jgi:hypothetical protein
MNDRSGLKQVHDHRWPVVDWTVARLTAPFDRIVEQNGLTPENWIEDGLGESSGFTLQLPSGLIIQVLQRAHTLRHCGHGPLLNADIKDVHLASIERVLSDSLAALGLKSTDVDWTNQAPTAAEVAEFEEACVRWAARVKNSK